MLGNGSAAHRLLDAVTGHERGPAEMFERDLERRVDGRRGSAPLCLALIGLDGVEALTARNGRRWAERQVSVVAAGLADIAQYDERLVTYRVGALTFATAMTDVGLEEAFDLAPVLWRAATRDSDSLLVTIGLAVLDGEHVADALTLEIAADAALDQARSLGQPELGPVVAAAPAGSGLRWLSSRSATSRSAAV